MIKIINVFQEGNKECSHDKWIYDVPSRVKFSYPQISVKNRICEQCGRLEEVEETDTLQKFVKDEFKQVYNRFNKED